WRALSGAAPVPGARRSSRSAGKEFGPADPGVGNPGPGHYAGAIGCPLRTWSGSGRRRNLLRAPARSLLLHWILNAAALWIAAAVVPGLDFTGGPGRLLLVAAVFGIINSTLRPLLTILTCPLIVVTLGLFTLVINALMLLATGRFSESWNLGFTVSGFWAAFCGGLVVGLVSTILSLGTGTRPSGRQPPDVSLQ